MPPSACDVLQPSGPIRLLCSRAPSALDADTHADAVHDARDLIALSLQGRALQDPACPLAITHLSAGNFDSPSWRRTYPIYLEKWGEKPPEEHP